MTYLVSETINNIDKILEYMKDCTKGGKSGAGVFGPLDLIDFSSYSKMFFREINRLPDGFYGDEENLLNIDEIIGLSTRSSYRFSTAIISRSSHVKKIALEYLTIYESLVEKIHTIYNTEGIDFTKEEDNGAKEVAQDFLNQLNRYRSLVDN